MCIIGISCSIPVEVEFGGLESVFNRRSRTSLNSIDVFPKVGLQPAPAMLYLERKQSQLFMVVVWEFKSRCL